MPDSPRPSTADAVFAHVQLIRAADKILDVAEELRQARDRLHELAHRQAAAGPQDEGDRHAD